MCPPTARNTPPCRPPCRCWSPLPQRPEPAAGVRVRLFSGPFSRGRLHWRCEHRWAKVAVEQVLGGCGWSLDMHAGVSTCCAQHGKGRGQAVTGAFRCMLAAGCKASSCSQSHLQGRSGPGAWLTLSSPLPQFLCSQACTLLRQQAREGVGRRMSMCHFLATYVHHLFRACWHVQHFLKFPCLILTVSRGLGHAFPIL